MKSQVSEVLGVSAQGQALSRDLCLLVRVCELAKLILDFGADTPKRLALSGVKAAPEDGEHPVCQSPDPDLR